VLSQILPVTIPPTMDKDCPKTHKRTEMIRTLMSINTSIVLLKCNTFLIFSIEFILNCYKSSKQFKICFGIDIETFGSIITAIGPQIHEKSLSVAANEKIKSGAPRYLQTPEDIMKLFFHWL
jgi:hypothetical protein